MAPTGGRWPDLPKFSRPPVVEVAIAVEFVPVPQLDVIRLVQLHAARREQFPKVQVQAALPPSQPASGSALAGLDFQFVTGTPPLRIWMLSEDEHVLMQVQQDRLILNWRRFDAASYPSYDVLSERFRDLWSGFAQEVSDIAAPQPTVAEVTFVNVIQPPAPRSDLQSVLTSSNAVGMPTFGALVDSAVHHVIEVRPSEDLVGQLVIRVGSSPNEEADLNMTVTTRMKLSGNAIDTPHIMEALDAAHASSVLGFTAITTPDIQAAWGREV